MPCDACIVVAVNVPATHEIDTLSLHDALPILEQHALAGGDTAGTIPARAAVVRKPARGGVRTVLPRQVARLPHAAPERVWVDRKSTRLNSSHSQNSYAVFCLKKKKKSKLQWPT